MTGCPPFSQLTDKMKRKRNTEDDESIDPTYCPSEDDVPDGTK